MTADRKPSYLELDRHLLGEARSERAERALAEDPGAQLHREALEAERGIVPGWVREQAERAEHARKRKLWPRLLWLSPALLIAGALAVIHPTPGSGPSSERAPFGYVGRKGVPTVGVFIRRGERVFLWDGSSALEAHDAIRLQVAPAEFRHVSLFALDPRGRLKRLAEQPLQPHLEVLLSGAWQLDAAPDSERLLIVFSASQLPRDSSLEGLETLAGRGELWITRLLFPKKVDR